MVRYLPFIATVISLPGMIRREGEGKEISGNNITIEKIPRKRRRRLLLLLEFLRNVDNIFSVNIYMAMQSFPFHFSTLRLPTLKGITVTLLTKSYCELGVW